MLGFFPQKITSSLTPHFLWNLNKELSLIYRKDYLRLKGADLGGAFLILENV